MAKEKPVAEPATEKTTAEINAERKAGAEARKAAQIAADRVSFWAAGSGKITQADLDALKPFVS